MMIRLVFVVLYVLVLMEGSVAQQIPPKSGPSKEHYHSKNHLSIKPTKNAIKDEELRSEYWHDVAQQMLSEKLQQKTSIQTAKNVIFFIGDGMSPQTVAATRMYLGNENEYLSFEKFPHLGQAKTYCVNRQVPDSACTGSSYLSGVKINYGMLNLAASIPRYTCEYDKSDKTEIDGLMKWAQDAGKATGIVTNTRVTHATPAASYAYSANGYWEGDQDVIDGKCDPLKTIDIARQMIYNEVPKNFNVILGGGRKYFLPREEKDEEGFHGSRLDAKNLLKEWMNIHSGMGESAYVWNKTGLVSVDFNKTDYLLGLFESSHLLYNLEVQQQNLDDMEPSLADMTEAAIKMLRKSEDGYVLFVEGGHIDTAHHESWTRLALDETAEFSKAIALARELTNLDDTLIVVSSDHSHTMTYNGYARRGQDVLGIADISDIDHLPYTTLSYANGPGYNGTYNPDNPTERLNISEYDFTLYNLRYPATVLMAAETHGGEDVAVYASGPQSHIFIGNYEQHAIPQLIAFASEIGDYAEPSDPDDDGGAGHLLASFALLLLPIAVIGLVS
ncbi:alkaline phosphatase-like [Topomyia yanbarensis]|uniref:alkaline phosphatase-like n=1 Tax=Topomyia yanbarensis TaxID=2498891 RepID=UPI00273C762C|nr:alkaline phosphatase-like [Topomyia yanbarensis]